MRVFTFSPFGYEGSLVEVEVDLRRGIPAVDIVGLADSQVKESRELARFVCANSGLSFPSERVLISLSPADIRKDFGMTFPMIMAILKEQYKVEGDDVMVLGNIEQSGVITPTRSVHGAVKVALAAGVKHFIVPKLNVNELKAFDNVEYISAENLTDTHLSFVKGEYKKMTKDISFECDEVLGVQFPKTELKELQSGYPRATKSLIVAAAGGHNVLFTGTPGCGKTLLLQQMPSLLPLLTEEEAQPTTRIWSLAGLMKPSDPLVRVRPFRMPYQTASIEGICGGGPNCRPGEISLAHNGTLFLDEAAEFRSSVLQMLRVPLENHTITLSRAGRMTTYPARFQLLMATNTCPCGNYGSRNKICLCSAKSVEMYWRKFSAPLLDRIDIRMFIERDESHTTSVSIDEARLYIAKAVLTQRKRGVKNADMTPEQIMEFCKLGETEQNFFDKISEKYQFSSRAATSILKMARTIADMEGTERILKPHLEEAIEFRCANIAGLELIEM